MKQYNIMLEIEQLKIVINLLQEGPYRIVKPVIDSIANQIDIQNQKETEEKDLTTKNN